MDRHWDAQQRFSGSNYSFYSGCDLDLNIFRCLSALDLY